MELLEAAEDELVDTGCAEGEYVLAMFSCTVKPSFEIQENDAALADRELDASENFSAEEVTRLTFLLSGESAGNVLDTGLSFGASTCSKNGDAGDADDDAGYVTEGTFGTSIVSMISALKPSG